MLVNVAFSLIEGGEQKIFSPMHMLVFRKLEKVDGKKQTPKKQNS